MLDLNQRRATFQAAALPTELIDRNSGVTPASERLHNSTSSQRGLLVPACAGKPLKCDTGFEPVLIAWKAIVLPLTPIARKGPTQNRTEFPSLQD